jgi:hypothetical protein
VSYNPPENLWYKFSFHLKPTNSFDLYLYDMNENPFVSVLKKNDSSTSNFNPIVIHGGYECVLDDLRIRRYTDSEPSLSTGVKEPV